MNCRSIGISKAIVLLLIAALALLGAGCKQRADSSSGNPTNGLRADNVKTIRAYRLSGNGEYTFEGDVFTPVSGIECVFETSDASKVNELLETFNVWSANENLRDAIDSAGKLFICFDDKISIEYIGNVELENAKHYGRVHMNGQVISCELPEAFGRFIAEL